MSWVLKMIRGSLTGSRFILKEGRYLLGRSPDCFIRFHPERERMVSWKHAEIEVSSHGAFLRDLNSRNGTTVHGKTVFEHRLNHGDVIQLGGTEGPIFVVEKEEKETQAPVQEKTDRPGATSTIVKQSLTRFSTYQPERHREIDSFQIAIGLTLGFIILFAIFLIMLNELGIAGTLVGAIFALFPAPFYLFVYLWMDRYDPEPGWALAGAFGWGALVAIFIAFGFNLFFTILLSIFHESGATDFLSAALVAPVVEEMIKGIGVILFWLLLKTEFDDIVDGIVYAGVIALGFATVENILYYGRGFLNDGWAGLAVVWVLRGMLSPFSHAFFTAMTGIGCGLARESHIRSHRVIFPLAGLFLAIVFHSAWNTLAMVSGSKFLLIYALVWVPLFLFFLVFIILLVRREGRIIRRMLEQEVLRGALTRNDVELIASFWGRLRWLISAFPDMNLIRKRRRFLRLATRLAFCYWHVERAQAAQAYTMSLPRIPDIYREFKQLRMVVLPHSSS